MADPIYSINDGAQFTVSELLANPTYFAKPTIDYLTGWDVANVVFEDLGRNNGVIAYDKDPAPFTEEGLATVAEFAEYPTTRAVGSGKSLIASEKEGRMLEFSYEMRDRNQVDRVSKSLEQLRNSAEFSRYKRVKAVLENSEIGSVVATDLWKSSSADPLGDTNEAIEMIVDAAVPDAADGEATYGFDPDTIVMPRSLVGTFVKSEEIRAAFSGNLAADNPVFRGYKGVTAQGYNGLQIVIPRFWYSDRILVLDSRNRPGFVSDTDPLAMFGPYDDPKRDTISYKLSGRRILGVDKPKAAAWITGVKA